MTHGYNFTINDVSYSIDFEEIKNIAEGKKSSLTVSERLDLLQSLCQNKVATNEILEERAKTIKPINWDNYVVTKQFVG